MGIIEAVVIAFDGDFGPWTFCILAFIIFPLSRKLQSLYVGVSQRRVITLVSFVTYLILGWLISSILNLTVQNKNDESERIRLQKKPLQDLIVCHLQGKSDNFNFENVNYILCDGQVYNADNKEMASIERSVEVLKKHNKPLNKTRNGWFLLRRRLF